MNVRSLLLRGNLRGSVHLGSQGTGEQSPMLMLVDTIRILRGINIFFIPCLLPALSRSRSRVEDTPSIEGNEGDKQRGGLKVLARYPSFEGYTFEQHS